MREIVLDTETTGFDPSAGHRIVEIGCVELVDHVPTGTEYHAYVNPERKVPPGAFSVHGLSWDFLKKYPKFSDSVKEFLDFIKDSQLVIHNAAFDLSFLNDELKKCKIEPIPSERATDTLSLARKLLPGRKATLDSLCEHFSISLTSRKKHGALTDSKLLAQVYLELLKIDGQVEEEYVAENNDSMPNGQETINYSSGDKYVGELQDGERHGQGTYTWPDGRKYVGKWKDDKWHGQGTYTHADGRKYVGKWKDGKYHGQGTYTWPDGDKYVGGWKDDKYHGQGTYTYADGRKYVGGWKDDKWHGQGTFTHPDGKKYVSEWKDGELQKDETGLTAGGVYLLFICMALVFASLKDCAA